MIPVLEFLFLYGGYFETFEFRGSRLHSWKEDTDPSYRSKRINMLMVCYAAAASVSCRILILNTWKRFY